MAIYWILIEQVTGYIFPKLLLPQPSLIITSFQWKKQWSVTLFCFALLGFLPDIKFSLDHLKSSGKILAFHTMAFKDFWPQSSIRSMFYFTTTYLTTLKIIISVLIGMSQWIECWPENQRVANLIPSRGTCLGCGPGPQWGACERQPHIDVSLPLFLLPFFSP